MRRKFLEELGIDKKAIDKIMYQNGKDIEMAKRNYNSIKKENEIVKSKLSGYGLEPRKEKDRNSIQIQVFL